MYRLEIITPDEMLVDGWDFSDFSELIIKYNRIKKSLINCNMYRGDQMQVFAGVDFENLRELEQYRITF